MMNSEIARRRLHQQRLIRPTLETPAAVVRWFGAVQAQEFTHALYALGLRMPSATEATVERAIAERDFIRTWPMRGTLHFIPSEDARWMLKLLAHDANGRAASIFRRAGVSDATYARGGDTLAQALRGGKQLTRPQLYAALEAAGIAARGGQLGPILLNYWSREGLICLGSRQGKQHSFALLDEWIPPAPLLEGDEALAVLARRYFISHGPATVYDFAWWSTLTLTKARQALRLVERELARDVIEGQTYWASPEQPPATSAGPTAYLLPPYDEFTVAYKDRSAALDPAFPADPFAILGPVVVLDDRIVGVWKRTLGKAAVTVALRLYVPLTAEQRAAVEQAAERYGRFIGLPVVIAW